MKSVSVSQAKYCHLTEKEALEFFHKSGDSSLFISHMMSGMISNAHCIMKFSTSRAAV